MEKEFIPYKESLSLKELGFDEQCLALYDLDGKITIEFVNWKNAVNRKNNYLISAPLHQQVFRWFREKKSLCSWVYQSNSGLYHYSILKDDRYLSSSYNNETTYKEAELACLKKLIEIIKKK